MNSDQRPGFWQRLVLAIIKISLLILLLAALAVGGFLAFTEIRRSFDSVTSRIEINRRDLALLGDDFNSMAAEAPDQDREIRDLQLTTEELDAKLSGFGAGYAQDLALQQELLAALEESLVTALDDSTAALSSGQTANQEAASLGTALVALQADLNDNNGRIDALGGEIDGLRSETETLDRAVGDLGQLTGLAVEAASEVVDMRQTVALFHVWELLTRARLRLVESNIGQATVDVERAFRAIDALDAATTSTDDETLIIVQTRLALAYSNLPDDPTFAARDLESAWDELDRILMARLLPDFEEGLVVEPVVASTEEAAPAAPEETASPVPEPTEPAPTPTSP